MTSRPTDHQHKEEGHSQWPDQQLRQSSAKEDQDSQAHLQEQLTSRSRYLHGYMHLVRQSTHHCNLHRHQWQGNRPASIITILVEDKAIWHLDLKE